MAIQVALTQNIDALCQIFSQESSPEILKSIILQRNALYQIMILIHGGETEALACDDHAEIFARVKKLSGAGISRHKQNSAVGIS